MIQSRKGFNPDNGIQTKENKNIAKPEVKKGETKAQQEAPKAKAKAKVKKKIVPAAKAETKVKKAAPVAAKTTEAPKLAAKPAPTGLRGQFSFVLYACAKETTRKYKVMLHGTGLTYTQYIALLALWDNDNINVKALGEQLYLDSGTLTPMLRKMEEAGFIARKRNVDDERNLYVCLTEKGKEMKSTMIDVEQSIRKELPFSEEESNQLLITLGKILDRF